MNPPAAVPAWASTVEVLMFDVGGTLTADVVDPDLGQKPIDGRAARTLARLHERGYALLIVSNTMENQTRWPALDAAGLRRCIKAALLSHAVGRAKPDPLIYRTVIALAEVPAERILSVGNNFQHDVLGPLGAGMHAALVRPHGLAPGQRLPEQVCVLAGVHDLLAFLPGPAHGREAPP